MAFSNETRFAHAIALLQAGDMIAAERQFKDVLRRAPKHVAALNLLSVVLTRLERYAEAERFIKSALKLNSNSDATFYNYGLILKALKRPNEAIEKFTQAISINGSIADTFNSRGTVFNEISRYRDALADFNIAISIQPNYPEAFCNSGSSLLGLNRYDDALSAYEKAIVLNPNFAEAWHGRGVTYHKLKEFDEALAAYDKALLLKPDFVVTWLGRGDAFYELKRYDDAIADYNKALALKPDLAEAWLGRGNIFTEIKRFDEALAAYDKALTLKPDLAEGWFGRGNVFFALRRFDEAFAAYDKALVLKSDLNDVEVLRLISKMQLCDWSNYDTETNRLISSIKRKALPVSPFPLLAIPSSSEDQQHFAKLWAENRYPLVAAPVWQGERYSHRRIRIAYLSADFHQHATSYLIAGMLEYHDRSRFEITAISIGENDGSETRQRIETSVDNFVDASLLDDDAIAAQIKSSEIDILIDLKGFTQNARTEIFQRRPSPVQVNYLGYPGTMGASFIDYIIADAVVIPADQREHYSEKIVILPHSYQANDSKRHISDRTLTRAEFGLSLTSFVFCCFNNNYKITPRIFDSWMRILREVENSALWLLEDNPAVARNLRKEAAARGVSAERLVFANRMPLPEHLARHRLADLFLDTLPYNAHTTASDAL